MSIVYLDEELPVIDFQTVISGDEELILDKSIETTDKKIGLNVHSSEDIYNQVFLLLQFLKEEINIPLEQKTKVFQKLITEITSDKDFKIPRNVVPEVATKRKDNSDLTNFINSYNNSIKIENYNIRREELLKTFQGYEIIEDDKPVLDNIYSGTRVIQEELQQPHIILPQDNLHPTVKSLNITKGISSYDSSYQELSMKDKLIEELDKTYSRISIPEENINIEETIKETISQTANIDEYIKELKDIGSLYDLWKDLMVTGIKLEDLNKETLNKLEEKLYKLYTSEKEIFSFLKATTSYKPSPIELNETGAIAFYEIQKEIFNKLEPIIEKLQNDLLEIYETFVDSNNNNSLNQSNASLPYTAYDIVSTIADNKISLSEAIEILKLRLLKEHRNRIENWLKSVKKWDVNRINEKVTKEYEKYQRTKFSFIDEKIYCWDIQDEIKKIKKGEIIGYQKDTSINTADSLFRQNEDIILEKDDPDELEIPIYDDNLPINIKDLDEGRREIFEIVLRMFMILKNISGLPLNYEYLYANIPQQLRKTKIIQIKEKIPDLSEEVYNILENVNVLNIDNISELISPGKFNEIKSSIKLIEEQFIKDIEEQLYHLLAWWIYDIQTHVLSRTLHFRVWDGSQEHIDLWTPYGYPLEQNKNTKEGVLPYIQHVIEDLINTQGTVWNTYMKGSSLSEIHNEIVNVLSSSEFSEKVSYLQENFKDFEKELPNKKLIFRGEKIIQDLNKTVNNKEKDKYLKDYMNFLNNLPSILIQSSIAKKIHIGCCLQLLSEKYRSDKDYWIKLNRNIFKLKTAFVADKYNRDKRPRLLNINKQEIEEDKDEKRIMYIERESSKTDISLWNLNDILSDIEQYIPNSDYNKLSKGGTQNIINVTNKNLNIYNKMVKDKTVIDFINSTDDNLQYLIELFRNIIQSQKYTIETDYRDKQDELQYLRSQFEKLYKLFDIILDSNSYLNELINIQKIRLVQYFISRQICFPAKPELARNDNLVIIKNNLESTLLKDFILSQYNNLKIWVVQKSFNKTFKFNEYISKQREQENITKLNIVNIMNPEERSLYVATKKLGISELVEYNMKFEKKLEEQQQLREAVDEYEERGEEDAYPIGENDDQINIDSLNDDRDY